MKKTIFFLRFIPIFLFLAVLSLSFRIGDAWFNLTEEEIIGPTQAQAQNSISMTPQATIPQTLTENEILETYKKMIETQIETYTTSSSDYTTAMTKEAASVYYHPNTSDWFKVSHILIKFSDEQTKQIETLKNQLNNNDISKENYNKQVKQIKNQTTVTERYYENGVLKYGNTYTAEQVLNMLTKAMEGKSYAEKMKIFNDYIYRFNMDDGVNNADTCYYIPTNPENDQMVESFANESRSLRQQGAGSISSSLVESTYGYHIVMYIGEITQLDYQSATLSSLNNIFINPFDEYIQDIGQVSLKSGYRRYLPCFWR